MKAYDIKKGNVVEHNGGVWQVRDIERSSPQGRGGNVTFRFIMYSVPGAQKLDLSLRSEDELRETELTRHDIWCADECFLTGTGAEVIPVVKLDGRVIGTGKPGLITAKVLESFRRKVLVEGVRT